MARTALGKPDANLAETQTKLDPFLPPNDAHTYNPGIYLRATGELIGLGGVFRARGGENEGLGWPEVGYMIREEFWGEGYATEFLGGFLGGWWGLARGDVVIEVDAEGVEGVEVEGVKGEGEGEEGIRRVPEMLCAVVEDGNGASLRVLEKVGFKRCKEWTTMSRREGEEGVEVRLVGFVCARPGV